MKRELDIASPYIGLRPFSHRDKDLFFGRPDDGSRLRDKILGSRLVVLYAPSGAGKSSLLRAMVIPELEELETVVMYVSRWEGRTPERLRRQLKLRLSLCGNHPTASADASLVTLAERASEELGKTVIIVLDQFEQCMVRYTATELEALRHEFGKLVRSNARLRLVLSLREEYAARLEVFRSQLTNLFQSTFFLPRMKREGGTQAIEEPAKLAGRNWDPKLVNELLNDLRALAALEGGRPKVAEGLELPFLQIVCRELWDEAARRGLSDIPEALYREMGGKDRIIDGYVGRVMGALSAPGQACAAEMLRYLAPPSGVKMSYPALDLVDYTRQPQERVTEVTDHLVRERVLREAVAGGQVSYELCHDAYIGMLRPWASQFRQRAFEAQRIEAGKQGVRKGALIAGIAGIALVTLIIGGWAAYKLVEGYRQTTWQVRRLIRDPQADANQILQSVILYLQRERSWEIPLHLARALEQAAPRIPPESVGRKRRVPAQREVRTARTARTAAVTPMVLQLNGRKGVDDERMAKQWAETSRAFSDWLGLPVPGMLEVREAASETSDAARLTGTPSKGKASGGTAKSHKEGVVIGARELNFEIPPITGKLRVIDEGRVPSRLKKVFRVYEKQWTRLPDAPFGGPRRLIQNWAAPLWEGAGTQVEPEEEVIALAIAGKLLENPDVLLTPDVVLTLLEAQDPQTVREAIAASGSLENLRGVLIEVLRKAHHLRWFGGVLEELSKQRGEPQTVAAERIFAALNDRQETLPAKFAGPLGPRRDSAAGVLTSGNFSNWALGRDDLRIYLGRTLAPALLQGSSPSPRFLRDFDALRGRLYREYGIQLPLPTLKTLNSPEAAENRVQLEDEEFAVEPRFPVQDGIAGVGSGPVPMRIVAVEHPEDGKTVDRVIRELEQVGLAGGRWLVDVPDEAYGSPAVNSKFAKADLRTLLRAMLNGSVSGRGGERVSRAPQREWTLKSLVFWTSAGSGSDPGQCLERLRQTARSMNLNSQPPAGGTGAAPAVVDGIRRLTLQDDARAALTFASAWKNYGENTATDFLAAYPAEVRMAQQKTFVTACENAASLDPWVRYDLESWLAAPGAAADQSRAQMKLCLGTAYIAGRTESEADELLHQVSTELNLSQWSGNDEVRAAQQLIEAGHMRTMGPVRRGLIRALVESGMAQVEDRKAAVKAFFDIREQCIQANLPSWCKDVMAVAERRAPPTYEIAGQVAADLVDGATRLSDLDEASRLVVKARSAPPYVEPERRSYAVGFLDVTDGSIQSARCQLGNCAGLAAGRELVTKVAQGGPSGDRGLKRMACRELVSNSVLAGDIAGGREWIRRAQSDGAEMDDEEYLVALAEGNFAEAQKVAERPAPANTEQDPKDRLFRLALAQLLTGSNRAERTVKDVCENTDHQYRDYLRLILYWRLNASGRATDAEELLQQRWKEVRPDTWRDRPEDAAVWRERLVGYYVNHLRRGEITDSLDDDAEFQKSALANLHLSRRALQCEGHFYVGLYLISQGPTKRAEAAREFEAAQRSGQKLFIEYYLARYFSRIAAAQTR